MLLSCQWRMLYRTYRFEEVNMNLDNQRLVEIQLLLTGYYNELKNTDSISDSLQIMEHIDKLETEQKTILERCNAL